MTDTATGPSPAADPASRPGDRGSDTSEPRGPPDTAPAASAVGSAFAESYQVVELLREYWGVTDSSETAQAGTRPAAPADDEPRPCDASRADRPWFYGQTLGDYRLLRELGRGGMGVVYEAEQLSRPRRVAVKVLSFASGLDAKQLQRFQNEALAVARLQHSYIVPIYEVGHERDVYYSVMRLIGGQNLATVIDELRQIAAPPDDALELTNLHVGPATGYLLDMFARSPSSYYRAIARIGWQVAVGLACVHDAGLVHRDVKPSNVLVSQTGRAWITDFGLARLPNNVNLTQSGELVGTLTYMAPEQAAGDRASVDARVDIYALGATLYHLLTLQSVFPARDPLSLLRQISSKTPQRPGRMNETVPRDLETITLKCLEKRAARRYETAHALAADLLCFLRGEPIGVRRPSWLNRTVQSLSAHPKVTLTGAAVLLPVVMALSLAAPQFGTDPESPHAAERPRSASDAAASPGPLETQRQRDESEEQMEHARVAADRLVRRAMRDMADVPESDAMRRILLSDALGFYREILEHDPSDPDLRRDTAAALNNMGQLQTESGHRTAAVDTLGEARAILEGLSEEYPSCGPCRQELAASLHQMSLILAVLDAGQSEELLQESLLLLDELIETHPEQRDSYRLLCRVHVDEAQLFARQGRFAEAEQHYREALALSDADRAAGTDDFEGRRISARGRHGLGVLLLDTYRYRDAEPFLIQARDLRTALLEIGSPRRMLQEELCETQLALSRLWLNLGQTADADSSLKAALELSQELRDRFPDARNYRLHDALCLQYRFRLLVSLKKTAAARESLQASAQLLRSAPRELPPWSEGCALLADAHWLLAMQALLAEDAQAPAHLESGRRVLDAALEQLPADTLLQSRYGWYLCNSPNRSYGDLERAQHLALQLAERQPDQHSHKRLLGVIQYRRGEFVAARQTLQTLVDLQEPGDPFAGIFLAMTHARLGEADAAREWYSRVLTTLQENAWYGDELRVFITEAALVLETAATPDTAESHSR